MKKRRKILLVVLCLIAFIYGFAFFFASDLFEMLVPFYELPRDCGANCAG